MTTPPSSCEGYNEKGYDIRRAYVACPLRGEATIKLTLFTCHPLINFIIPLSIYLYIYLFIYLSICVSYINVDVVKVFGVESILLFNALLLKKKVVVYAPELQTVLDTCRYVSMAT